ncbi:hypothetical protein KIPB_013779, partial [Kipferlia bialata]
IFPCPSLQDVLRFHMGKMADESDKVGNYLVECIEEVEEQEWTGL